MKRFVEGDDRKQVALLPECVDDYIGIDNPVSATERPLDIVSSTNWRFSPGVRRRYLRAPLTSVHSVTVSMISFMGTVTYVPREKAWRQLHQASTWSQSDGYAKPMAHMRAKRPFAGRASWMRAAYR
jgi:hypothetical protein